MEKNKTVVLLLSGGLDSSTCLAWALAEGYHVHALTINYGQKHASELQAVDALIQRYPVKSHRQVNVDWAGPLGSALTDSSVNVPDAGGLGIPATYVPARNTVFLSIALGLSEVLNASKIILGVNAVDYSGYPDCRAEFLDAFQFMANKATKSGVEGHMVEVVAPLLHLTKADIIRMGLQLGLDYRMTVSCYRADEFGRACGSCDACSLRKKGFELAGSEDFTHYYEFS